MALSTRFSTEDCQIGPPDSLALRCPEAMFPSDQKCPVRVCKSPFLLEGIKHDRVQMRLNIMLPPEPGAPFLDECPGRLPDAPVHVVHGLHGPVEVCF